MTFVYCIVCEMAGVSCNLCEKIFMAQGSLRKHRITRDRTIGECDTCKLTSMTHRNLRRHKLIEHENRTHVCDSCPAQFSNVCNLSKHKLVKCKGTTYDCSKCTDQFNNVSILRRHKMNSPSCAQSCEGGARPHPRSAQQRCVNLLDL